MKPAEPTTPPQITTDQILSIVINTLFDIPENSQIQVPYESIVKRITLLKAGFISLEERERIQGLLKKVEDEKSVLLAEIAAIKENSSESENPWRVKDLEEMKEEKLREENGQL